MDGNGRWAQKRGLPRHQGHWKGAETTQELLKWCNKKGVRYLTIFSFSTENWKRPKEEINTIFTIFVDYLTERIDRVIEQNSRLRFIGDLEELSEEVREACYRAEELTSRSTGMVINVAVNYGGRNEILRAAREWDGKSPFESHLHTASQPNPDLMIRTGGEFRISNFLLWQLAYTELYFTETLWPDFSEKDLDLAFEEFSRRQRRYGGIR